MWLHRKLSAPLTTALAVLLVAILIERVHRITGLTLVLAGLAAGFCYFVADGILIGLGEAGIVHPASAAWVMPGLLALVIIFAPRGQDRRADTP